LSGQTAALARHANGIMIDVLSLKPVFCCVIDWEWTALQHSMDSAIEKHRRFSRHWRALQDALLYRESGDYGAHYSHVNEF